MYLACLTTLRSYISSSDMINKSTIKLVCYSIYIAAVLILLDFLIGFTLSRIIPRMNHCEETSCLYYTLNEMDAQVVIIGGSKVITDYNPEIMESVLKKSVFTVTADNSGISFQYAVADAILDRYKPDLLVLDMVEEYVFSEENDWINTLSPFYGQYNAVTEVINNESDWKETLLMKSNLYRYNTILPRILLRSIISRNHPLKSGYKLRDRDFLEPIPDFSQQKPEPVIPYKKNYLDKIVKKASEKGVKIVFTVSPVFRERAVDIQSNSYLQSLSESLDVPLISDYRFDAVNERRDMFVDYLHLNTKGATIYSEHVANQLKDYLQ